MLDNLRKHRGVTRLSLRGCWHVTDKGFVQLAGKDLFCVWVCVCVCVCFVCSIGASVCVCGCPPRHHHHLPNERMLDNLRKHCGVTRLSLRGCWHVADKGFVQLAGMSMLALSSLYFVCMFCVMFVCMCVPAQAPRDDKAKPQGLLTRHRQGICAVGRYVRGAFVVCLY